MIAMAREVGRIRDQSGCNHGCRTSPALYHREGTRRGGATRRRAGRLVIRDEPRSDL